MSETALQIGTILQGKTYSYCIEKVLGQGSFGITYMANIKLQGELGILNVNTRVAIKEFFMRDINGRENSTVTSGGKGGLYDKYKQKFAKEAINLSKLNHLNIIKVLESFEANNTVYYVMEYIDGESLNNYIERQHGISEQESISLIKKVASAVNYMHSNKMLHLDIKPSNIMLRKSGEPILIDFGLSKQFDENGIPESSTSIGGGTPGYASIEQFNYHGSNSLPVTMDVYAVGATLFKLLTGVCPPEASLILNDGFPSYMLQCKQISNNTTAAIEKAMSATVTTRYKSVQEFMMALPDVGEETIIDPIPQKPIEPIIPPQPETPKKKEQRETPKKPSSHDTIRWIDVKQFLETIPYKTRYASVSILSTIAFILLVSTADISIDHDDSLAWLTLTLCPILGAIIIGLSTSLNKGLYAIITILTIFGSLIFLSGIDYFIEHWITLGSLGIFLFAIYLGTATHSGIISKIYNIEECDKPYRRIQNRYGKWGLCYCGKMKMTRLLPLRFNSIVQCGEHAYICNRTGLTGLYNAQLRKMVLPMNKYPITYVAKDIVAVYRDGKTSKYTTKGYRVVDE